MIIHDIAQIKFDKAEFKALKKIFKTGHLRMSHTHFDDIYKLCGVYDVLSVLPAKKLDKNHVKFSMQKDNLISNGILTVNDEGLVFNWLNLQKVVEANSIEWKLYIAVGLYIPLLILLPIAYWQVFEMFNINIEIMGLKSSIIVAIIHYASLPLFILDYEKK